MARADDIAAYARQALGVKYVWGGNSLTSGVDCSGLVQQVYAHFGIQLPRVTYDQINAGSAVGMNKLRVGDLVFFDTDTSRRGPDHVGIYLGRGKFIHAPRPGESVKISSLTDSYYADRFMAGRRIPGVQGGAQGGGSFAGPGPVLDDTELAERYGMSVAFFDSQPELKKLLNEAVAGQWTADRFQAQLKGTKWWQENSASARQAQILAQDDPATYRASVAAQRALIQQQAVEMGAILTDKQLDKAARDSLAYQWNEAQVQNFLGKYIKFRADGTLGGQAGTVAQQIVSMAQDLGLRIGEQTVKNYAQYVVRGVSSMQEVQAQLMEQAVGSYPGWEEQIRAGESVQAMASPYIQMMAEELELPDTDISIRTPRVRDAINARNRKGEPSPMSLTDFQVELRTDPRWKRTRSAQDQMAAVGRQVLADMGLIASSGG